MYWPNALLHVSRCATLTDQATSSNTPVQLEHVHPPTNPPAVYCVALPPALESVHASPLQQSSQVLTKAEVCNV